MRTGSWVALLLAIVLLFLPWFDVSASAGAVAAGFLALKFLFHIHFSLFGLGSYLAVVLAAALVLLASRARQSRSGPIAGSGG